MAMFVVRKTGILIGFIILAVWLSAGMSTAGDTFDVDHPLTPPAKEFSGQCPVCGMSRSMWARTWVRFDEVDGISEVCSFHCLADLSLKSGAVPGSIRLALYHSPQTMVRADKAVIVMGSSAKGTMSPTSKIVFSDPQDAEAFVAQKGGQTVRFQDALDMARASVVKENTMLVRKRLKKGKIIEPTADDRCQVCEMYPIRYPKHKCQILAKDKKRYHFCSTQCMFAFLNAPAQYGAAGLESLLIWVNDFSSGKWIGGRSAYYVSGVKTIYGPMGAEAFPFHKKSDARSFVDTHGGQIMLFDAVKVH
jgi:copper chaperone NosL